MSRARATEISQAKKRAFLAAYAVTGNISDAARAAKVSRELHYRWQESDKKYAAEFDVAHEKAIDSLELEARRRAFEGTERPVFYQGEVCGRIREYSDTLLIFLLKAARPAKYRERHEFSGPSGSPIALRIIEEEVTNGNGS